MKKSINWKHWHQRHGVKVWEACLLSLGADPASVLREFQIALYVRSSSSPQIINSLFPGSYLQSEYHRRLELAAGYLDQPAIFTIVSKSDPNRYLWEVQVSEFAAWANQIGLVIPAEMNSLAAGSNAALVVPPVDHPAVAAVAAVAQSAPAHVKNWEQIAIELAKVEIARKPTLSLDQIADSISKKFDEMSDEGDIRVRGRGGKIPSAANIRRNALIGLKPMRRPTT